MRKAKIPGYSLKFLYERNGIFCYRRPVPAELRKLAGRSEFKESLKTTEPKAALVRYVDVHERAEQFHTSLLMGEVPSRSIHRPVARLKELSQTFDLEYRPASELIKDDNLDELLKRYSVWAKAGNMLSKWMGHSKIETTAIYANALGAEQRQIAEKCG